MGKDLSNLIYQVTFAVPYRKGDKQQYEKNYYSVYSTYCFTWPIAGTKRRSQICTGALGRTYTIQRGFRPRILQ